jgi:signal peptidase II
MDDPTPVRRLPLALVIAATVVALDQATKLWAERTLTDRAPIKVLGDFLQLRLLYNPGAAFSIGEGATWIFTIATAAAASCLLWYIARPHPKAWLIGLALMLGGATTHLADRLFRPPGFAQGHVVDFIDYNGWFVGNIADIALVGGAAWLALQALQKPEAAKTSD